MNYAIESMDLTDFYRFYSDRHEKEYKTEKFPEQKRCCSGITELLMSYHFHQIYNTVKSGDFRGTFSHLKHFNNRRDFIRAKI